MAFVFLSDLFHLVPSMWSQMMRFLFFYGREIFHYTYVPTLYYLPIDRHLGYFHRLAIVNNNSVMMVSVHFSFQIVLLFG